MNAKTTTDNPIDLVEHDLMAVKATLRGAFAMLTSIPHYGNSHHEHGETLCDAGTILIDANKRIDSIFERLAHFDPDGPIEA